MDGEKYLKERVKKIDESKAHISSAIILRLVLLTVLLVGGWVSCDQGLKFVANHPEFDHTRTDKLGEFYDARHR